MRADNKGRPRPKVDGCQDYSVHGTRSTLRWFASVEGRRWSVGVVLHVLHIPDPAYLIRESVPTTRTYQHRTATYFQGPLMDPRSPKEGSKHRTEYTVWCSQYSVGQVA